MSTAPKIIYPCDHMISRKDLTYGDIKMVRNEMLGVPDRVPPNIDIKRIDEVMNKDKSVEFSPGIDYTQRSSLNIIEWINQNIAPAPGEEYTIRACYMLTTIKQDEPEKCERCNGNGWYVDLFNGQETQTVLGADKLAQDVIKILFTEKVEGSSYGCSIKDVLAQNIYNEVDLTLSITDHINDCADQIKASQLEQINQGDTLTADEMLRDIIVENVLFVRDEATCYIEITVISEDGGTTGFTFMINE